MELICIDKRTFDELCVRFQGFEERVTRLCRPTVDLGLKNWLDNQEACEILRVSKKALQAYRAKYCLSAASNIRFFTSRKTCGNCWNPVITL